MKAVIMQPTYLPWIGYFDLMDQSDTFVLLDHVQFSKQSWHQKNRIKTPNGELMLTVPIIRNHPQMINETKINNDQPWRKTHLKSIQANYSKAKYYDKYIGFLEDIYLRKIENLTDLTIPIILWAKEKLGIECKIIKSSEINAGGAKVNLVVDICHKIGADEYLSPPGSKEYIDENNIFEKENIKLEYQKYEHPEYAQLWGKFMPYISVIDLLFNEGGKSLDIIRSGRKI
jgi:hypothetical protein